MEDFYYVPDLKNNILNIGRLREKGYSIFMKDKMLHLKDKSGKVLARVEMTKNRMFKLNLKINAHSLRSEGKVVDAEEILKTSKALEAHIVEIEVVEEMLKTSKALEAHIAEMEVAKNKAQVVAHVMKDGIFNPPFDEESGVVI